MRKGWRRAVARVFRWDTWSRIGCGLALLLPLSARPTPEVFVSSDVLSVDLHCDALYQMVTHQYSIHEGAKAPAAYTPEVSHSLMVKGKLSAQTFAIWVPGERMRDPEVYAQEALRAFQEMTKAGTGFLAVRRSDDLYRARTEGLRGALLSIEGAEAIGDRAENLRPWADAGLIFIGLVWNRLNAFADPSQSKKKPFGGLSAEGERLVDLAAELGVLVDISHASDDAFWDVVERTTRPVIATHSSARSIYEHPRNLDDEQIRAIASTGGVIGINFHSSFLTAKGADIDDVVAHALHVRAVGGAGVVGLGADYDGGIKTPKGLENVSHLPALREALQKAGLPEDEIDLMWGRNLARALAKAHGAAPLSPGQIPIPLVATVSASSEAKDAPAARVLDHNGRTAWRPLASDKTPSLTLSGEGPAPHELALRGPVGGPVEVLIRVETASASHEARLTVPEGIDGVGLRLPALSGEGWRVIVSFPSGTRGLAELLAYRVPALSRALP